LDLPNAWHYPDQKETLDTLEDHFVNLYIPTIEKLAVVKDEFVFSGRESQHTETERVLEKLTKVALSLKTLTLVDEFSETSCPSRPHNSLGSMGLHLIDITSNIFSETLSGHNDSVPEDYRTHPLGDSSPLAQYYRSMYDGWVGR